MQSTIYAPMDGKVTQLLAQPGKSGCERSAGCIHKLGYALLFLLLWRPEPWQPREPDCHTSKMFYDEAKNDVLRSAEKVPENLFV